MAQLKLAKLNGFKPFSTTKVNEIYFSEPLTLISGLNGTGKSSVIEAFQVLLTKENFSVDLYNINSSGSASLILKITKDQKDFDFTKNLKFSSKTLETDKTLEAKLKKIFPDVFVDLKSWSSLIHNVILCTHDEGNWVFNKSQFQSTFELLLNIDKYKIALTNIKSRETEEKSIQCQIEKDFKKLQYDYKEDHNKILKELKKKRDHLAQMESLVENKGRVLEKKKEDLAKKKEIMKELSEFLQSNDNGDSFNHYSLAFAEKSRDVEQIERNLKDKLKKKKENDAKFQKLKENEEKKEQIFQLDQKIIKLELDIEKFQKIPLDKETSLISKLEIDLNSKETEFSNFKKLIEKNNLEISKSEAHIHYLKKSIQENGVGLEKLNKEHIYLEEKKCFTCGKVLEESSTLLESTLLAIQVSKEKSKTLKEEQNNFLKSLEEMKVNQTHFEVNMKVINEDLMNIRSLLHDLREKIRSHENTISRLQNSLNTCFKEKNSFKINQFDYTIKDIETERKEIDLDIETLISQLSQENQEFARLKNLKEEIDQKITNHSLIRKSKQREQNQLSNSIELLEKEIEYLNKEIHTTQGGIIISKENIQEYEENEKKKTLSFEKDSQDFTHMIETMKEIIMDLNLTDQKLKSALTTYINNSIQNINKTINENWEMVYPNQDIRNIQIYHQNIENITDFNIGFKYEFSGKDAKYYSKGDRCEYQLSTGLKKLLALTIRFSIFEQFSDSIKFFSLDEPISNLHEDYYPLVGNLIKKYLKKDVKVIIISHDPKILDHINFKETVETYYMIEKQEKVLKDSIRFDSSIKLCQTDIKKRKRDEESDFQNKKK